MSPSARQKSAPPLSGLSRSILPRSSVSRTDEVRYLTVNDVIELHQAVTVEFGGQDGGEVNEFWLKNAVERPQATILGRDAYPRFFEKAAAFFFVLVVRMPFQSANKRLSVASLMAFCELNGRSIDFNILDERMIGSLVRMAANFESRGIPQEKVFAEIRGAMFRAISPSD